MSDENMILEDLIDPSNLSFIETTMKTLFSQLKSINGVILYDCGNDDFEELAREYYFRCYKRPFKAVWPHYFETYVDWTDSTSVSNFFSRIASVVNGRFGDNMASIWNAYFNTAYSPLENYSMEETRTPNLTHESVTSRNTDSKVETKGSTSIVPFNDTESTLTGESDGESTTSEGYTKNYINNSLVETGNEKLTRHGNIGVTSSQQLLESELALRKLDFQELLFKNIDSVLFRGYVPID